MKRTAGKTKRVLAVLMFTVMTVTCLSACAGGEAEIRPPWHPSDIQKPVQESEPAAVTQTPENAPAGSTAADPAPVQTPEKTEAPEDSQAPEEPDADSAGANPDPAGIQGIARLGDLVGKYTMWLFETQKGQYIFVDTEDSHNPYDLTWRYGPDTNRLKEVESPEWDALYRSYVDACDWSLVFDVEYYKKAFPMLAKLYHDNDALLLEHFQTQGVHEGRQASANFNVSAYMANCDGVLVDAFGENYECYYFYYMLNQNTQKSVSTKNSDSAYPRWLTLELSMQQSDEYKGVNNYRERAKAAPIEIDPEIVALANYRAWTDAEYNLYAHDWIADPANDKEIYDILRNLSCDRLGENTVKWYSTDNKNGRDMFVVSYARSKDHYDAMVSTSYCYFGCSNPYWSDNPDNPFAEDGGTGYVCQFDLFAASQPHIPYELG